MRSATAIIVLCLAPLVCASAVAGDEEAITTTRLTERIYQLSTDQGEYTTNTLVSVGDDGVLVVDTQTRDVAEELKGVIEGFGRGAPKLIINTHRHIEHVGGNAIFGDEPIIIAHELVRSELRSGGYLFEELPDAALPDITFDHSLKLYFNGEEIRLIAMPGSHDDNEIIVHFTDSKVVHLSSLVNGFNFPSVDSAGNALAFPEVIAKALEVLPEDVVIVSGHNANGTMDDLRTYHAMMVATIAAVREGLASGKDVATLKKEGVLDQWSSYAGSYVSTDEWIDTVAKAISSNGEAPKPKVFESLYHAYKADGAEAAVGLYHQLEEQHPDEYDFNDVDLLVIGMKLEDRGDHRSAVPFLEASLEEHPDHQYSYYAAYQLARAQQALGHREQALASCRRALELKPDDETIKKLLASLESPE